MELKRPLPPKQRARDPKRPHNRVRQLTSPFLTRQSAAERRALLRLPPVANARQAMPLVPIRVEEKLEPLVGPLNATRAVRSVARQRRRYKRVVGKLKRVRNRRRAVPNPRPPFAPRRQIGRRHQNCGNGGSQKSDGTTR